MNTGYRASKTSSGSRQSSPLGRSIALSLPLRENDKHDLVRDEGFVCRYISLCLCLCSLHRRVSLADFPLCPHISVSLLPARSICAVCVNSPSPCLCRITQSAPDAAAGPCWQESRRWCPLPGQESDLSPKWIHIWYWFPHSQSIWIKPASDLILDAPFQCVLQQDAFHMSRE